VSVTVVPVAVRIAVMEKHHDLDRFADKLAEIGDSLEAVTVENPDRAEAVFHDLGRDLKAAAEALRSPKP
jgi:hypothetical protein